MFDNLSNRLDGIVKRLRGKGRLTEADVDEVMKEIRSALLEADVNVTVVRSVCNRIREHAIGAIRSQALDPGQQVVKAVHDELIRILGGETLKISYASKPPTVVLMAGLQGSGKTTASGKLALGSSRRAATRCWWVPTSSAPPPSSSCARSAARSTCRSTPTRRSRAHRVPGRRGGQAARP